MAVYHSTKALLEGLVALAASCSSKLELKTLNTTNDGWPLRSASIGSGPTKVLLSFGIHGREYMTSEIAMNFLTKLCSGDEHKLLNDVTFTTIPVFNPDGRARTDAALGLGTGIRDQSCGDRRKNGKFVDLNRNFDWDWDDLVASSGDALSTSYRGPAPNSEIESQTLDALAGAVKPDMYIDIHTGTLAMYAPWNHNSSGAPNTDEAIALLNKVATGTSWHRDQRPKFGVGGIVSYLASGTAADFIFAKHHPRYAFIFETYLEAANAGNTESRMGISSADLTQKLPRGAMAHRVAANRRPPPRAADSLQPQELRRLALQRSTFANATVSSSKPSEWVGDSCFEYFSPTDDEGLEGLVRAWTSALLLASRTLVVDMARDASQAGGTSVGQGLRRAV